MRCGDNGTFRGAPLTLEQKSLSCFARSIYEEYPYDGKYILDGQRMIICQSNAPTEELRDSHPFAEVNPLGDWTGGTDVDTGATNRKLGSDMADGVTGGGLHGKDLSKADISVNIYAFDSVRFYVRIIILPMSFRFLRISYRILRAAMDAAKAQSTFLFYPFRLSVFDFNRLNRTLAFTDSASYAGIRYRWNMNCSYLMDRKTCSFRRF